MCKWSVMAYSGIFILLSIVALLRGTYVKRSTTAKYRFDCNKLTESNEFTITPEMLTKKMSQISI